ncbi:MAG: hypothetical protein K0Q64_2139 [Nitrobacter vulgaris]|jgi:hypothetical protein|nr:hypothetical protein [Nitrobacter vulgaris]
MNRKKAMAQINKFVTRNGLNAVLLFATAASLAACVARPQEPQAVSSTKPSITYSYTDDRALMEATRKAEAYCAPYNTWPRTDSFHNLPEGGRNVTFVCDQPRTAALVAPQSAVIVSQPMVTQTAVPTAPPPVAYSYRDDRGLVEASNLAARYCMGYSAQARSTLVQSNVDGSKTITFDCVRTM